MVVSDFRKQQIDHVKDCVSDALLTKLHETDITPCFILHEQQVRDRYVKLRRAIPDIEPHFAVKACPMPELLKIYKDIGAHLDVASEGELDILKQLRYAPELLIYTHPHKTKRAMKTAYDYGIRTFVLDDLSETAVLEPYKDSIKVFVRLSFSNHDAEIDLSYKFGLAISHATDVIGKLLRDGYDIVGCSFHVGSQMHSADAYADALIKTAAVYKEVAKKHKHKLEMLDIGGGFPTPYTEPVMEIEGFAAVINPLVSKYFADVHVVSEPGRYLINPCVTLASKVTSVTTRVDRPWVFIDDGIYSSFSDMLSGHSKYLLLNARELSGAKPTVSHVVAGPTCDSIDVLDAAALLPKTEVGDVLLTPNMGAYSYALACEFNSIPKSKVIVV